MATSSASLGCVFVECLVVSCSKGKWPLVVLAKGVCVCGMFSCFLFKR